jgi:hypothetical protein
VAHPIGSSYGAHLNRISEESWMSGFMYKLEQVDVVRLISKMFAHKLENGPFYQKRIIDGLEAHSLDAMPGQFPMTRLNLVNDIIRNGEVRMQLCTGRHETWIEVQGSRLTNTTTHPRIAAFTYSESFNCRPLKSSAASTTRRPALYLPV